MFRCAAVNRRGVTKVFRHPVLTFETQIEASVAAAMINDLRERMTEEAKSKT